MANSNSNAIPADDATAKALGYFNAVAWLQQPNGAFLVEEGCARDHAHMRATQLASLLSLMNVDAPKGFMLLGDSAKQSLLWLALQLADDLKAVLPLAAAEGTAQ